MRKATEMPKPKPKKVWSYSPARDPKATPSATTKAAVAQKAKESIDAVLTPRHVQPPPEDSNFNYISGLSTRWHGRYFYFVATYTCPGPDAIAPTFESNFARLEHTASGRFHLSFMRHNDKWHQLFADLTLEECLKAIQEDPWFQP